MNSTLLEKQGYKKTELGLIPEGWDLVDLYDIRNKEDRYSFTGGPFGSDLKSEHYTEDGIRIIQLQNIGDGKFLDNYAVYTSNEKADELLSCNIYPDEIIMAKMDPVARACFIPDYDNRYLMCSDGIRLSVDKEKYDNKYIFYAINSKYFRKEADSKATGTTRKRIGLSELKGLKLIIPNLPEQQKIAEILSTVDEKIDFIYKQIEQTEQLKKGLMQELLTKGIGHTEFKDTEIGRVPKNWEVIKLTDITEKISDGIHTTPKYVSESEYYFINGNNLVKGRIEITNNTKCVCFDEYALHRRELGDNTILLSINGTIGNLAFYNNEQVILGKSACYINLNKDVNKGFIYYILDSQTIKNYFNLELTGTTIRNLSIQSIKNAKIPFPPMQEQQNIAYILSTVDSKIETLQNKKAEYENLKKGLMQKLLTGQIRIKVSEEQNQPKLRLIKTSKETVIVPKYTQLPVLTAEKIIQQVINYWNTYRRIDLKEIAKLNGILVYKDEIPPRGQTHYNKEKNMWEILVQDLNDNYTIAHELAHIIKHSSEAKMADVARKGDNSLGNFKEWQAESLASEIAMPEECVEEYLSEQSMNQKIAMFERKFVNQCAKRFNVSILAMKFRLENLGYKVPRV